MKNLFMKNIITSFFCSCLLPFSLSAQPTVSNNEYYNAGDIIQMVDADTSGLTAGAAGSGVTWDFSMLGGEGSYNISVITDTAASSSIIANIEEVLPNGQQEYIEENSTDSYINGIYNTATGATSYCSGYDIAKRPVTYNTNYADTYSIYIPGYAGMMGRGYIYQTGDAYGTLMLPGGSSYSNVLRVKKIQYEIDTVSASPSYTTALNAVSYLWFDGVHPAPLLRIDSITNIEGLSRTIMYLATTTGVQNVSNNIPQYKAWFDDNSLQLTGNFEANKNYEVVVYDMIGAKIFSQQFTGNSDNKHFDINRQVAPGIYIVSIVQTDDLSSREMSKIVKH